MPVAMVSSPAGAATDRIVLSVRRTRRDLWVSLSVAVVGAVLYAAFDVSRAAYHGGGASVAVAVILGWIGSIFLFVGLIFVGINWWLLRKRELA